MFQTGKQIPKQTALHLKNVHLVKIGRLIEQPFIKGFDVKTVPRLSGSVIKQYNKISFISLYSFNTFIFMSAVWVFIFHFYKHILWHSVHSETGKLVLFHYCFTCKTSILPNPCVKIIELLCKTLPSETCSAFSKVQGFFFTSINTNAVLMQCFSSSFSPWFFPNLMKLQKQPSHHLIYLFFSSSNITFIVCPQLELKKMEGELQQLSPPVLHLPFLLKLIRRHILLLLL